jgi:P-type Ca2+ transporter type 2C
MTAAIPSPKSPPEQGPVWHTLSIDDVQREERVDIATGLSQAQAEERLKKYGPNTFAAEKKEPGWRAFLRQYQDPMQIVMLVAGILSAIIQQWGTALLLVALTVFAVPMIALLLTTLLAIPALNIDLLLFLSIAP